MIWSMQNPAGLRTGIPPLPVAPSWCACPAWRTSCRQAWCVQGHDLTEARRRYAWVLCARHGRCMKPETQRRMRAEDGIGRVTRFPCGDCRMQALPRPATRFERGDYPGQSDRCEAAARTTLVRLVQGCTIVNQQVRPAGRVNTSPSEYQRIAAT